MSNLLGTATVPLTLQADYHADVSGILHIGDMTKITLVVAYAMGASEAGNSILLKYEYSSDGTTYFRITDTVLSSGAGTISIREDTFAAVAAAEAYDYFTVEFNDVCARYLKVSAKESGVASNFGSCYIVAVTTDR